MKIRVVLLCFLAVLLGAAERKPAKVALDINTATVEELEQLPSIGRGRAEMIVRIRTRNGPFKRIDELRALPRLSEKQFEQIKEHVMVGQVKQRPQDHGK